MNTHCPVCLTSRTGDILDAACKTPGCAGVISEVPTFASLIDALPEPITCGRRYDQYFGGVPVHADQTTGLDHWQRFKSTGDRVCSYCGSLHPDDMFALVSAAANAPEDAPYASVVEIEPSDKNYKIYVHRPGVRNAMEGGIKFYTQHLPRRDDGRIDVSEERQAEFGRAIEASAGRFARMLASQRERS